MIKYFEVDKAVIDAIKARNEFGIPIEYPSTVLRDVPDNLWGALHIIRSETIPQTLGPTTIGENDNPGIIQIDVHYPKNKGEGILLKKVDDVASSFAIGSSIVYNATMLKLTNISVSTIRHLDGWIKCSISINYTVRSTR